MKTAIDFLQGKYSIELANKPRIGFLYEFNESKSQLLP